MSDHNDADLVARIEDWAQRIAAEIPAYEPHASLPRPPRRTRVLVAVAAAAVIGAAALTITRLASDPNDDQTRIASPTTPADAAPPTVAPTATGAGTTSTAAPFGRATAVPAAVPAGRSVVLTPDGAVAPTCGQVGVLRDVNADHRLVGQVTASGTFEPGPDVTWLACAPPATSDPLVSFIPDDVPSGRYLLCMTQNVDERGCATITVADPPPPDQLPADGLRIEIDAGCPASITDAPIDPATGSIGVANPDVAGLDTSFVPGDVAAALICRYTALGADTHTPDGQPLDQGAVYSATELTPADAASLAAELNSISYWNFTPSCLAGEDSIRYTAITFAVAERPDVNVWLKDTRGCPTVTNGVKDSGFLVNNHGQAFVNALEAHAPAAPHPSE